MSTKNARILGIRLDEKDASRVAHFEKTTHIEGVSLARAALKAALHTFEQNGTLSLPLRIVEDPNKPEPAPQPFVVTKIIGPDPIKPTPAQLAESKLNEQPPPPADVTNRLRDRFGKKPGTTTR